MNPASRCWLLLLLLRCLTHATAATLETRKELVIGDAL
jgi:hypothetical protein